jgi:hypothetical protein
LIDIKVDAVAGPIALGLGCIRERKVITAVVNATGTSAVRCRVKGNDDIIAIGAELTR